MTQIYSLNRSNREIINLIKTNEPFSIVRLGIGPETLITYDYDISNEIVDKYLHPQYKSLYNAGIYTKNGDISKIKLFIHSYNYAIKNADLLASFKHSIVKEQSYFAQKYNVKQIHNRAVEPFYQIIDHIKPWTHHLLGKKILVIHPFIDSFQKQLNNNFQIFNKKQNRIFLEGQEFVFYKSFQTIAGNHIHNDWFETFSIMCKDIAKLDFDIALLGCGGYGLPLCNYIKTKLKKSAVYVGGGLQMLFGVMGKRWENDDMWLKIIKNNNSSFIKPSGSEICNNLNTIEDGCYW